MRFAAHDQAQEEDERGRRQRGQGPARVEGGPTGFAEENVLCFSRKQRRLNNSEGTNQ
jgi:hypothetical protein